MQSDLKFSLFENKLNTDEKRYVARTYVNGVYDHKKLIARMASKGVFKESQYESFFRELLSISQEVMIEGNAIHIGKVLRLAPVVKGSFDSVSDGYTEGRNYIDVTASVSKKFVAGIEEKINVEKIAKPKVKAELKDVINVKTKENELCQHFSNKIIGNYFKFHGFDFAGIELLNYRNAEQRVSFGPDDLNVSDMIGTCLNFTFRYDLQIPEWLTDGLEIYVRFLYSEIDDSLDDEVTRKTLDSNQILTKWKKL